MRPSLKKSIRRLAFLSFLTLFIPAILAHAKDQEKAIADTTTPIQIHGDVVEYFQEENKTIGTGHVVIDYDGAKLEADKITVYMGMKKAVAEGNVTLTQGGSVFKGPHAEYDYEKKIGYVDKMSATVPLTPPDLSKQSTQPALPVNEITNQEYFIKARRIEKVSDTQFRAVDSYVTTCCGDSPFYKIQARQIDIFPKDKIVIRNALMYIKGVPVLFIPYFVQPMVDFNRLPVELVPGKSREWGAFLLSKWRYNLVNREDFSVKGAALLDYREKRGFGEGLDTYYHGDKVGHGVIRGYYANDNESPINATPDRYRAQWRHQSKITKDTTMTVEINKLSDDQIVKDFFYREEYERSVVPDNYISIITTKPEYTFSILERHRIDEFYSSVNRDPELRFDTHNRPIGNTPFYLRHEAQFTNLQKEFSRQSDELHVTRFDLNHTLSYAGHVGGFAVTPRIGARETFYSRDLAGDTSHVRSIVDPGLDISTKYYKIYDVFINRWGLDYNQIRHTFEPSLSYNYRPTPTVFYTTLQPFDDIDALDKQHFARFYFQNNFQTKEHGSDGTLSSREIARIGPYVDFNALNSRLENLGVEAELRPYSWLGMNSQVQMDTHLGKVNTANFDIYYDRNPWVVGIGQRYLLDESSQTTAYAELKIKDWEFKVYERFEFQENKSKEFEATVSKYWNCIITDFTYNHAEGDTFYFAIRLKAFPALPFSLRQTYNQPRANAIREF